MLLFTLIISYMWAGCIACNDDNCTDLGLTIQLYETRFMPNRTQLEILCPEIIGYLECEKTFMECHGRSLDELATSSDRVKSKLALALLGGLSLMRELCDDESTLQHDYLESVECVRTHIVNIGGMCVTVAFQPTEDFFKQLYPIESEFFDHYSQVSCFKDAFHTACMVDKIGDTCGSVAQRTAVYGLERMRQAFNANRCEGVKNSEDLKASFFDFLELDEQKRSTIQRVFNFFTRK